MTRRGPASHFNEVRQWRTDVMQSWEYKVATVADIALFEKMLNDRGTEGWELIAVRGAEWIFKRPK
jgi:Domain of unknown function (DUF4177)